MRLIGFKTFGLMTIRGKHRLITGRGGWPESGIMVAECRPYGSRRADHLNLEVHGPSPSARCKCGVHAYATIEDLRIDRSKADLTGIIWGAVLGSGRYFAAQSPDGYFYWRAEKVELIALHEWPYPRKPKSGAGHRQFAGAARRYGVPVLDQEKIRLFAEERGEYIQEVKTA